jgi:peptidoglycan/LPS O-acetylase OafA/YrhL
MSTNPTRPAARHPIGTQILLLVAGTAAFVGGTILVATALGFGQADVRGMRLEGGLERLFLGGLAVAVAGALAAALGLARRRRWAAGLLAAVWPAFALVCLALDRMAPAPGEGRSLLFYLVGIGLIPAVLTLMIGRIGGRRQARPRRASRRAERPSPAGRR